MQPAFHALLDRNYTPHVLAKISKAAGIYGAPLAIIVCADHNKTWVRPFDAMIQSQADFDAF